MTLPVVLTIAGCIALLIGIFGGQIKIQVIEVHEVSRVQRVVSSLVGLVFIGLALWLYFYVPPAPAPIASQPAEAASPTMISTTPASTPALPSNTPIPTPTPTLTASPVVPTLLPPTAVQIAITNLPSQPTMIPFPSDLVGVWSGNGKNIVNGTSYDTSSSVTITNPCVSGNVCGQGFIPTVNCSFTLTYLREDNGRFFFEEGNYIGNCGTSKLDYLQLLSNGKLLFHSESNFGMINVIMTR